MILGKIVAGNKLYGTQSNETTCEPIIGADLEMQLAEALKNINGTYKAAEIETPIENAEVIPALDNSRKFSFCEFNGNIYYREAGDTMEKINVSKDIFNRAMGMIELRDNVHELLNLQLDNSDKSLDTKISESRMRLNKSYDEFVKKYGNISDRKNAKAFKGDNGYKLLSALELKDEKGKVVGKADIFNKNTIKPKIIASRVETAEEALILSVSEKGKVDFEFMTELCGMDKDRLISALDGQIYKLPQETEKYVTADEYLTGNIRKKMEDITNCYDPQAYEKDYKALQAAMPPRVEAKDIYVKDIRNSIDYTTGVSKFTVQNEAFLDLLPRTGIAGKEDLKNHLSAAFGSMAFVIDSDKRYILNSENEWQEITVSSSGGLGGSGDGSNLPNYIEITNDEIVSWFEDDNI